VLQEQVSGAFAARVTDLLKCTEYRRADTPEEKEAVFRLRYEAYRREGSIEPIESGLFTDAEDDTPNAWLIGIFVDGSLASSIRLHIASQPDHYLPVTRVFPDVIVPRLEAGNTIIDATRLTSRLEFTRTFPFLPYVTMRAAFLAASQFNADYIAAAFRREHQGAYRRMYGAKKWSDARPYPPLTKPQVLMAYDYKAMWPVTRERYPFLQSTPEERLALFSRSSTVAPESDGELDQSAVLRPGTEYSIRQPAPHRNQDPGDRMARERPTRPAIA
jgi:hypothetical protein